TLMAELVASGESPRAATIYNHNAERLVVKGAPIRWKALKPTFGRPNAIGVARHAPHPYAALLFSDFMLSLEGQTILKERNRVPSSRAVDTHLNKFPFEMIDPVITLDEADRWEKLWSDLFLKGQKIQKEVDCACRDRAKEDASHEAAWIQSSREPARCGHGSFRAGNRAGQSERHGRGGRPVCGSRAPAQAGRGRQEGRRAQPLHLGAIRRHGAARRRLREEIRSEGQRVARGLGEGAAARRRR